MKRSRYKQVKKALADVGISLDHIVRERSHPVLQVSRGDLTARLTIAASPSCARGLRNVVSSARRQFNQMENQC